MTKRKSFIPPTDSKTVDVEQWIQLDLLNGSYPMLEIRLPHPQYCPHCFEEHGLVCPDLGGEEH